MIVIAAVDDGYGMMFNHRRQSQDRALRERILSLSRHGVLWMSQYSGTQFSDGGTALPAHVRVDDDFMEKAAPEEYCFLEDTPAAPYEDRIGQIILFRWNRKYPGDFHFDIDLASGGWALSSTEDFPGFSHEKITMEVYGK